MKHIKLFRSFIVESLNDKDLEFFDNHIDYSNGQHYYTVSLKLNSNIVAFANYSIYNDVIQIDYIESIVKGKEYGQMVMKYLADKYGYENLERSSLTPDGAKMRQKLDKHFNFDYDKHLKSKNKHLNLDVINNITNPIIKGFITDMVNNGYEETWKKYLSDENFHLLAKEIENKYDIDFNDIADITSWIKDSVTNDNSITDNVPKFILKELSILFKIR